MPQAAKNAAAAGTLGGFMKKIIATAVLACSISFGAGAAKAETFLTILTGGTSGIYYPLGVALSSIYADGMEGVRTSVQSTKASVENLNLLQRQRGEMALADSAGRAWRGEAEAGFPRKLDKLRVLAAIYPNYLQIVTRADSDIHSLADLKGKRMAVGAPKSGTELHARTVLTAAGMSYDDLKQVEYLPFGESVELMKNRQIDAALISAGMGVAAIRDLSASTPVKVVSIPREVLERIEDPGYIAAILPEGTYDGIDADVPIVGVRNYLVSHDEVPEDMAYNMVRLMFENMDQMIAAQAAAREIKLEAAAKDLPLPLHPGAERYYREIGQLN
jgi:TRAP transporter TAXI family solute receptor